MKKRKILAILFVFVIVFNIVSPLDTISAANNLEYESVGKEEEIVEDKEEDYEAGINDFITDEEEDYELIEENNFYPVNEENNILEELAYGKNNFQSSISRNIIDYITNLSVSEQNINDGGKTIVRIDFAEGNGNIQGGDIINISWPTSGDIYFEGYKNQKPLYKDGKHIADLIVEKNGARIVFNDIVNNLDDVNGWAEFEVQGRNITNTSNEDIKTGLITAGDKSASVNITKPVSGTSSTFYYKTGDILPDDTDHVRWFLAINNNKSYVDEDIRIEDNIGKGQQLDPDSFSISVDGTHPKHYIGKEGIEQFARDFSGAGVDYNITNNSIVVYIPTQYASLNSFTIMYLTKITDYDMEVFENYTKAWYKENGEEAVYGKEENASVSNIYSGVGVNGTVKGELQIQKIIEGTNIGIPNVKFELRRIDGGEIINGEKLVTVSTDKDGIINIKKLPEGDYQIKEVYAPDWIDFKSENSEYLNFSVNATDTKGTILEISNNKKMTSLTVNKLWTDAPDHKPTITIQLYKNGVAEGNPIFLENGNLEYTWDNLPISDDYGNIFNYTVKEVGEDNGVIVLNNLKYEIEISEVIENEIYIENKLRPEKKFYEVYKYWEDNNNQDGKRPEEVIVKLFADGQETGDKLILNEENNWSGKFTDLQIKNLSDNKEIVYTIEEEFVQGYTPEIIKREANGIIDMIYPFNEVELNNKFIITNKYEPEIQDISGEKIWEDNNNQDGKRPSSITIKLLSNGEIIEEREIDSSKNWSWNFKSLPVYKNGEKIHYSIEEVTVDNYETKIENYNIRNIYTPEKINIPVTKNWDDNNNLDGKRPSSIYVKLIANGKDTEKRLELNEYNDWYGNFQNIDKYVDGKEILYTVEEVEVTGYESQLKGDLETGFIITNIKKTIPETPDPKDPDKPVTETPDPKDPDKPVTETPDPKDPDKPVTETPDPKDPDKPVTETPDPKDPDKPIIETPDPKDPKDPTKEVSKDTTDRNTSSEKLEKISGKEGKNLPRTGIINNNILIIFGLALLILGMIFLRKGKKS